jgi:hypothetical protein
MSDSEEAETVEQTDSEEATIMVADPDDYQKTKKLKSIYEAKNHVSNLRQNRNERVEYLGDNFKRVGGGPAMFADELAASIADYGNELLPLIEEGKEKGVIEDDDLEAQIRPDDPISIEKFIILDGQIREGNDYTSEVTSMAVFRQLQRIQRKLGLGLDLEEEQTPAEI